MKNQSVSALNSALVDAKNLYQTRLFQLAAGRLKQVRELRNLKKTIAKLQYFLSVRAQKTER